MAVKRHKGIHLYAQTERIRKNDITKKIAYNKDGTPKSMVTVLKELQKEAAKDGK